jgi:hypothetical protein
MLPERVDPTSIPVEYLLKTWDVLSKFSDTNEGLKPISLRELYRASKSSRGWIIRSMHTGENTLIFRSKTNDEMFQNWRSTDFYLLETLPLIMNSRLKLKRKPKTVNKTKEKT